ncbi:ABC transporter permease [Adhaeribacter aquaticus]|uniref:ABC transporter permease n=1 Tax=Adhaeribacter aquaticus TaxID=299567 RepID=UPI0003F87162|nr:ABC transporter permease [Adhaeribacter aquaticus]
MLKNYFKIAVRNLVRHKGYTLINLVGLAVGIACCTLIMLFVQDELNFDKNHRQAANIYRLTIEIMENGRIDKAAVTSPPIAPELKRNFPEIKAVVRFSNNTRNLIRKESTGMYADQGFFVDSTVFRVFTFPLTVGNPRTALVEPHSIVLSQELAKQYFGNANPIGKVLEIELDSIYQVKVTGVLAAIPENSHIRPNYLIPFDLLKNNRNNWWAFGFHSYMLVDDHFNPEKFESKLPAFVKKYMPVPAGSPPPPSLHVQPLLNVHLDNDISSQISPPGDLKYIYLFSVLALFIILLACINFMNLATARSQNRSKEVGVRKVIGATRQQLIGQFLSESILLGVVSLVIAIGLVYFSLPAFNELSGKVIPGQLLKNGPVVVGLSMLTVVVGLAAGLYPAFFLSAFKPIQVLKGQLSTTTKGVVLRKGLVVLQFAISIGLIVGTAVVYNQMEYIQNKRLGFTKEQLISIPLNGQFGVAKANTIKNEFLRLPGVVAGTVANTMPGNRGWWRTIINLAQNPGNNAVGFVFETDFDYFSTMDIQLADGRAFDTKFPKDSTQAVLINEAMVKAFGWTSTKEALEKHLEYNDNGLDFKVVGVVKDFNFQTLHAKVEPAIFAIARNNVGYLVLRISPDQVAQTLSALQQKWNEFDDRHPFEYSFVDENLNNLYQTEMRLGKIFSVFTALAIFIACLGLFGLASFTTEQRTKEIGIRKVLGASVGGIVAMLSKDFLKLVLLANVIAWPLAWYGMNQWLQGFEYRTAISWWIFGLSAFIALLIALFTVSFHAIKAAISNPVNALRSE